MLDTDDKRAIGFKSSTVCVGYRREGEGTASMKERGCMIGDKRGYGVR